MKLDTGEELPADLVVYATGYGSMNGLAADIVGQEMADKVGKVWGLGSDTTKDPGPWEGEERNMWKPTQQEGLWFHGGNLHQSRYYSLYLALQLKARAEGIADPRLRPCRRSTTRHRGQPRRTFAAQSRMASAAASASAGPVFHDDTLIRMPRPPRHTFRPPRPAVALHGGDDRAGGLCRPEAGPAPG